MKSEKEIRDKIKEIETKSFKIGNFIFLESRRRAIVVLKWVLQEDVRCYENNNGI